ncbi:MAG: hypothetical protein D3916_12015 [Candidatus Electrothrix sp. MAN1_4]|nr:hypothetical protein [Candidatus Electrothrix sp. MAN1_4]
MALKKGTTQFSSEKGLAVWNETRWVVSTSALLITHWAVMIKAESKYERRDCYMTADIFIGKYHWPAFNVADSGITVGVTIFFLLQIFEGEKKKEDTTQKQP